MPSEGEHVHATFLTTVQHVVQQNTVRSPQMQADVNLIFWEKLNSEWNVTYFYME